MVGRERSGKASACRKQAVRTRRKKARQGAGAERGLRSRGSPGGGAASKAKHTKPAIRRSINLACVREPKLGRPSQRTAEVGLNFGIPLFGSKTTVIEPLRLKLQPGQIVLLLGPSGSGKSSALAEIERQFAGVCNVSRVGFSADAAIIDQVAPWGSLRDAVGLLTSCGLGEPHLWVRRFEELSDGERFRARLARALALQSRTGTATPLLGDEFCSMLHRRAAKAISFNLRKLVARRGLIVVLASSNEDVVSDLQPDVIVHLRGGGRGDAERRDERKRRSISFARRLQIERGSKRDYDAFAPMHYRMTDDLGFVDKVFLLREGRAGEVLGIVVYAHSPLELALRNQVTNRRFSRNAQRLNRCFRILRRLVVHPDIRGCGLGHYLVRKTLPLVGTEYVECLAAMGEFNPVFERAGMECIGQYEVSADRQTALEQLRAMDIDPNSRAFPMYVARRRRVRAIVAQVVLRWYSATTSAGLDRVERQSPQLLAQTFRGLIGCRPVYYLWRRRKAHKGSRAA